MSKIDKLLEKLYKKPIPNDIRIEELVRIAKYFGCETKGGGNHQLRIVHIQTGTVIPIPCHGDVVKPAYIKEFKLLLDEIILKEEI